MQIITLVPGLTQVGANLLWGNMYGELFGFALFFQGITLFTASLAVLRITVAISRSDYGLQIP